MTRDEKNLKLAKAVGYKIDESGFAHERGCKNPQDFKACDCPMVPDFYTDELGNALLLEKMTRPMLSRDNNQWICAYDFRDFKSEATASDRKTAVAESYLKFLAL